MRDSNVFKLNKPEQNDPLQTGLRDIEIKVPKVRDRSGSCIKFCNCSTKNSQNQKLWKPDDNPDHGVQTDGSSTEKMVPLERL